MKLWVKTTDIRRAACVGLAALSCLAWAEPNTPDQAQPATEPMQADASAARQVVEAFQASLIEVMQKADELGYQGRYDALEGPIRESHDLATIIKIAVGSGQLKVLDEVQRQQLSDTFSRLVVATYAYNFNGYGGETFQFVSEQATKRDGRMVRTLLKVPGDDSVSFDYILRQKKGCWQVVNIVANGVSDLALKRSEYGSVLGQSGFDGLLMKMHEKIEHYAGQAKTGEQGV